MSEGTPLNRETVLFLDPDEDFLAQMREHGRERQHARLVTVNFSKRNRGNVEELIFENYPDLVVINLDVDDELNFAAIVTEILSMPVGLPPILLGLTTRGDLNYKVKAYKAGIDEYLLKPVNPLEVWLRMDVLLRMRRLQKQFDNATRKLSGMNIKLSETNQKLEELTVTDELTGLHNMRYMTSYLEKQFPLLTRYQRPFSIMMIDLDNFKQVNDKNDHLVGSAAIRTIGRTIDTFTRTSDIKARYGGDEYIVAMPETDYEQAKIAAERLRKAIEERELTAHGDHVFHITASIGTATFDPKQHKAFTDLVKEADFSMYHSKKRGRNCSTHYSDLLASGEGRENAYNETQSSVMTAINKVIEKRPRKRAVGE